ncbi:MAG TPA: glycosyltransferase [Acidimicrobiales bacterium]|jgi:cellulose synthase/poly-beta-1,6-N-acetylglucosamine synthase-like glycosyltransferase|nr:glycosyltransferase [Acidimicrobiales bacterium]
MNTEVSLIIAIPAGVVIAFGLLYVVALTGLGMRTSRKAGLPVSAQEGLIDAAPDLSADLHGFSFYFLIAALDEEAVIGGTVAAILSEQGGSSVVVVDDGSSDRTAEIAGSFGYTGKVRVLSRKPPEARQGKGQALNAGLALIRQDVEQSGLSLSKVIVVVMDADGRLTPNATAAVSDAFASDPSVGGLQLMVRIRNRDSLALWLQDMEFWAMSGIGQLGRMSLGSVSMGGNGQFTRLSALDEVGVRPWSASLTEDLDLSISLSALGWKTTSTPFAYVTQQGVPDLKRLIRQRTRWFQGHMMAIKRLPELARSRYLATGRFLELSAYLSMPWLISLPWSLVQQYLIFEILTGHSMLGIRTATWWAKVIVILFWYATSFGPQIFWAVVYSRRARHIKLWKALVLSHLTILWTYTTHIAVWRAVARIVLKRNGWAKTRREAEDDVAVDQLSAPLTAAA